MKAIAILQIVAWLFVCLNSSAADSTNTPVPAIGNQASGSETNSPSVPDPIDRLVAKLTSSRGFWENGSYPVLGLPATASTDEVVARTFKTTGFDRGYVTNYEVLKSRQIHIRGSLPDLYTAVLVQTEFGQKIVLFKYGTAAGWWSRVYDANVTYYKNHQSQKLEPIAGGDDMPVRAGDIELPAKWRSTADSAAMFEISNSLPNPIVFIKHDCVPLHGLVEVPDGDVWHTRSRNFIAPCPFRPFSLQPGSNAFFSVVAPTNRVWRAICSGRMGTNEVVFRSGLYEGPYYESGLNTDR